MQGFSNNEGEMVVLKAEELERIFAIFHTDD